MGIIGTILRTTDGGDTWNPQTSGTAGALAGVWFTDVSTGTAVGVGGTILRTTDGGSTWYPRSSGTTVYLLDLAYADSLTGLAVGYVGTILQTRDGGETWTSLPSGTKNRLTAASLIDGQAGIAVGSGGAILRTPGGGVTGVGAGQHVVTPAGFSLMQNYPNPFNPATVIPFTVPATEWVSLAVLDVLGREVAVLVNGPVEAGTHTVEWTATGMASGVYLYRLRAGSHSATKTLILLR